MDYTHLKDLIEQYTGLERDALHVHVALFIYIVAALIFRRSRRSLLPWFIVFGVEIANEAHDLWRSVAVGENPVFGESLKDLWNTMLWPTVLLVVGRHTKWSLWHAGTEPAADARDPDSAPEDRAGSSEGRADD
jgi:hypothetical protein